MSKGLTSPRRRIPTGRECSIVAGTQQRLGGKEKSLSDRFIQFVAVFIAARHATIAPERRREARSEGEKMIVVSVESDS